MKLVITDNLSFTDYYHGNSQWQCFIANQNQECHCTCQWMTNCQWWQVSWNAPPPPGLPYSRLCARIAQPKLLQGADPGFSLGGGGGGWRMIMCAHAHHEREPRSPFYCRGPALGFFDALSCYLSLLFKHSDTKWDKKEEKKSINLKGAPVAPPLNPPLELPHVSREREDLFYYCRVGFFTVS